MRETDLYAPIKSFLEGQGYEVKAEVASADVVACRADEEPLIVELKTSFSLALVHQGVLIEELCHRLASQTSGSAPTEVHA